MHQQILYFNITGPDFGLFWFSNRENTDHNTFSFIFLGNWTCLNFTLPPLLLRSMKLSSVSHSVSLSVRACTLFVSDWRIPQHQHQPSLSLFVQTDQLQLSKTTQRAGSQCSLLIISASASVVAHDKRGHRGVKDELRRIPPSPPPPLPARPEVCPLPGGNVEVNIRTWW